MYMIAEMLAASHDKRRSLERRNEELAKQNSDLRDILWRQNEKIKSLEVV